MHHSRTRMDSLMTRQRKKRWTDSVAFRMEDRYLLLLEVSAAADLIRSEANALKIEGGPRVLLAAGVEDVDAAYEELKARGVTFLRPQPTSPGGCAQRTLPIPKATSGRSTSPLKRRQRGKRSLPSPVLARLPTTWSARSSTSSRPPVMTSHWCGPC